MKKMVCAMVAAMAAAMALATGVSISYQGQLRSGTGEVIASEKPILISFRIYEQATGGTALWGRCYAVTLDAEGYFNVELSDSAGSDLNPKIANTLENLLAEKAQSSTLYIGLEVDKSTGEIAPRQKLLSVPVAAFAKNVQEAQRDFTVNGTARFKGGVVAESGLTVHGVTDVANVNVSGTIKMSGGARIQTSVGVDLVPSGVIVMWSGSANNIPKGWVLCNGKNNTPDLSGRFIVGYDANNKNDYDVGKKGGEPKHTLVASEMPKHNHAYRFTGADLNASWDSDNYFYCSVDKYSGNTNTKHTDSAGGNSSGNTEPHENRPPYYAICFIMKQ